MTLVIAGILKASYIIHYGLSYGPLGDLTSLIDFYYNVVICLSNE